METKTIKCVTKTAVLCGKASKFSAKYATKSQIPLKRNYEAKFMVKTGVVTILASGKWAQKQPSYKGIWEKKRRQKQ